MANRSHPLTVATRVNRRQLARIDAAAALQGVTRSVYVRQAVLPQVESDLRGEYEVPDDGEHEDTLEE